MLEGVHRANVELNAPLGLQVAGVGLHAVGVDARLAEHLEPGTPAGTDVEDGTARAEGDDVGEVRAGPLLGGAPGVVHRLLEGAVEPVVGALGLPPGRRPIAKGLGPGAARWRGGGPARGRRPGEGPPELLGDEVGARQAEAQLGEAPLGLLSGRLELELARGDPASKALVLGRERLGTARQLAGQLAEAHLEVLGEVAELGPQQPDPVVVPGKGLALSALDELAQALERLLERLEIPAVALEDRERRVDRRPVAVEHLGVPLRGLRRRLDPAAVLLGQLREPAEARPQPLELVAVALEHRQRRVDRRPVAPEHLAVLVDRGARAVDLVAVALEHRQRRLDRPAVALHGPGEVLDAGSLRRERVMQLEGQGVELLMAQPVELRLDEPPQLTEALDEEVVELDLPAEHRPGEAGDDPLPDPAPSPGAGEEAEVRVRRAQAAPAGLPAAARSLRGVRHRLSCPPVSTCRPRLLRTPAAGSKGPIPATLRSPP